MPFQLARNTTDAITFAQLGLGYPTRADAMTALKMRDPIERVFMRIFEVKKTANGFEVEEDFV